jgi:hypothetical protein
MVSGFDLAGVQSPFALMHRATFSFTTDGRRGSRLVEGIKANEVR